MSIDETFRVNLQVAGRDQVKQTSADLRALKAESAAVGATDAEWDKLTASITATTTATSRATAAADRHVEATNRASASAGRLGMGVNAAAQGLQDMQYGFTAGLNNLSNAAMLFGASGGLVAAITVAGVAAQQLYNQWGNLMEGLGVTSRTAVPQAADALKALEDQIKANAKAIDEYRERQRLTSDELTKYNRLVENQAVLERIAATERERKAAVDKLRAIKPADDQARGAGVTAAIGEVGGEKFLAAVEAMVKARGPGVLGRFAPGGTPREAAESIVRQAAAGSESVGGFLQELMGASPIGRRLRAHSPEQAQRAAAAEAAIAEEAARTAREQAQARQDEQAQREAQQAQREQARAPRGDPAADWARTKADVLQMAGLDPGLAGDVSDDQVAEIYQALAEAQQQAHQQAQLAAQVAAAMRQQQEQQARMWQQLAGQAQRDQQRQQARGWPLQPTFGGGW